MEISATESFPIIIGITGPSAGWLLLSPSQPESLFGDSTDNYAPNSEW